MQKRTIGAFVDKVARILIIQDPVKSINMGRMYYDKDAFKIAYRLFYDDSPCVETIVRDGFRELYINVELSGQEIAGLTELITAAWQEYQASLEN